MDAYTERMTRAVRTLDSKLYCQRSLSGKVLVMRKHKAYYSYQMDDYILTVTIPSDHLVMALTHNWSIKGEPVLWGEVPLLERLRQIDRSNKEDLFQEMEKQHAKVKESKNRDLKNNAESFFSDMRSAFMKDFSDINTANMDKSKDLRRKYDKKLKE